MAISETLNLIINSVHRGDGEKRAASGLKEVLGAAKALAGAAVVQQIGKYAVELTNIGIASQATSQRFERFAGDAETAAAMLSAVQDASYGTISRMEAMTAATKMLQMGLVNNSDEMETMAAVAIRLGDQTQDAGARMADFSALLANQSIPRLDNFGISSGKVRERVAELKKEGYALDEAFKLAVLEEGTKSLAVLGDTSETAAVQVGQIKATFQDAKEYAGILTATILELSRILGIAGSETQTFRGQIERSRTELDNWRASGYSFKALWQGIVTGTIPDGTIATQSLTAAQEAARWATTKHTAAIREEERGISSVSYVAEGRIRYLHNQVTSQDALMQTVLDTAEALEEEKRATEEASRAAAEMDLYLNNAAMTFTDYYRRVADEAEQYTQDREGLETEHQAKLATLTAQGNSDLITQENERYAQELALLEENRRAQEEEQRQSLGRMVLQHFQSWAQMQGLTAEEMLKMTLNIQEQYGLIDEGAAQHVLAMSNNWAAQLRIMRGETTGFVADVTATLNSIPTERTVTVHYQTTGSTSGLPGEEAQYETGGSTRYQLGTGFAMGGMALVGESGPELVQLPRGARVFSAGQTRRAGGMGGTVINIGPVRIVGEDPAVIWRQLERYARLKGKSGWSQLGR